MPSHGPRQNAIGDWSSEEKAQKVYERKMEFERNIEGPIKGAGESRGAAAGGGHTASTGRVAGVHGACPRVSPGWLQVGRVRGCDRLGGSKGSPKCVRLALWVLGAVEGSG